MVPLRAVYSEAMFAPPQGGISPSAAKPRSVMEAWRREWPELVVRPPTPVRIEDLERAHCPRYVADVLALRTPNGFGTRSRELNDSLFHTSGALLTAARWALADGGAVAAPVSGFHHAHWDAGEGFCTFNGLLVAALALRAAGKVKRVGILDYDFHYGNGTDDIIDRLGIDWIVHVTAGASYHQPQQARAFLQAIDAHLESMRGCDLVLYQAGADPHVEDPLGGFLTTTELLSRDYKVFAGLARRGIPVAWDLAGGYQQPLARVVEIHVNTMRMVEAVHGSTPQAGPASE